MHAYNVNKTIALAIALPMANMALTMTAFFLVSGIPVLDYVLYALPFLAAGFVIGHKQLTPLLVANVALSYIVATLLWGWAFWLGLGASLLVAVPMGYLAGQILTAMIKEELPVLKGSTFEA